MLSLKRTLANSDGFVQVAIGAELEHQVDVVLGLKGLEQVDSVGVVAEVQVDAELLGALIDGKGRGAVDGGGALGDDLDGHGLVGYKILGLEDHTKGAIVERGDCFVSSM